MFKSPKVPRVPSEAEAKAERAKEESSAAAEEQLAAKKRQGVLATLKTRGGALGVATSDEYLSPGF